MMLFEVLREILKADAAVAILVDDRIEPGWIGQDPVLPKIMYEVTGGGNTRTQRGSSNLVKQLFEVNCWAVDYIGAAVLGNAVDKALDGYKGTISGHHVQGIFTDAPSDAYEDASTLWRYRIGVTMWGEEI